MDSGIGIGGLSTGKEEYVTSAFDLFTSTEVEIVQGIAIWMPI